MCVALSAYFLNIVSLRDDRLHLASAMVLVCRSDSMLFSGFPRVRYRPKSGVTAEIFVVELTFYSYTQWVPALEVAEWRRVFGNSKLKSESACVPSRPRDKVALIYWNIHSCGSRVHSEFEWNILPCESEYFHSRALSANFYLFWDGNFTRRNLESVPGRNR